MAPWSCGFIGQGLRDRIPPSSILSFDGRAGQLKIDGSVSDWKKRRKHKQLESDGSARQLKQKPKRICAMEFEWMAQFISKTNPIYISKSTTNFMSVIEKSKS